MLGLPDAWAQTSGAESKAAELAKAAQTSKAVKDSAPDAQAKSAILSSIQKLDPSVTDVQIEATPLPGIYWALLPTNEAFLLRADGQYY